MFGDFGHVLLASSRDLQRPGDAAVLADAPEVDGHEDDNDERQHQYVQHVPAKQCLAADLFAEWESELRSINNARLKEDSRHKLKDTKDRYAALHSAMKRAERSMTPVLAQFKDQVLYLKHNLNAQAIGSLQGETVNIEAEIRKLVDDMNASIAEANASPFQTATGHEAVATPAAEPVVRFFVTAAVPEGSGQDAGQALTSAPTPWQTELAASRLAKLPVACRVGPC